MAHPKLIVRRPRNTTTKKKVRSPAKEKFGIPILRNTQEALIIDKNNGNTL